VEANTMNIKGDRSLYNEKLRRMPITYRAVVIFVSKICLRGKKFEDSRFLKYYSMSIGESATSQKN
jgi:hypothetical protein